MKTSSLMKLLWFYFKLNNFFIRIHFFRIIGIMHMNNNYSFLIWWINAITFICFLVVNYNLVKYKKKIPIFRVAKWTTNYVNVCIMDTASSQVEVFSICLFSPQTDGEHKQIKQHLTCEDVIQWILVWTINFTFMVKKLNELSFYF
jgi:hypothetical protein